MYVLYKVALVDVDGHNFPSLPLMKLSAWHKKQGDSVEWHNPFEYYDKIYMSKVFDFTPDYDYAYNADEIIRGGTGYRDIDLKAALPIEIESICPDYSLYPQFSEAYGFLTRGCPRNCKFCIVTQKEGNQAVRVADITDFFQNQKTIRLLDPNIVACAERETLLQQLSTTNAYIDFTQGLDIRLMDSDTIKLLNRLKSKMLHFAWDNPKEDLTPHFKRFNEHSAIKDERKKSVYVLTNFNSSHDEDLFRVYTLRDLGYSPYIMIYDKPNAPKITRNLQRWVNNRFIFRSTKSFDEYKV